MTPKILQIRFDQHGLGDCVHFALLLQLYRRRGWDVAVKGERNKRPVWEAAGCYVSDDDTFRPHPWDYPGGFDDLSQPDHINNKVAWGIRHRCMPPIGEQQELWQELCNEIEIDGTPVIEQHHIHETTAFLEDMPRPIILVHTRGSNWQERKSLPIETAFNLILQLLRTTEGSVISLDFDSREPIVAHPRCKGIVPAWGMISVERMLALYAQADLMIGIDSGPFHLASFSQVPAMGVFRSIHPVRCCLPNRRATYMVCGCYDHEWRPREDQWNFAYYRDFEPTADEISAVAMHRLKHITSMRLLTEEEEKTLEGLWQYKRVGHDSRTLGFESGGKIRKGRADCEMRWEVSKVNGVRCITIHGRDRPTCMLSEQPDQTYRGHWLHSERMPIVLRRLPDALSTQADSSPSRRRREARGVAG